MRRLQMNGTDLLMAYEETYFQANESYKAGNFSEAQKGFKKAIELYYELQERLEDGYLERNVFRVATLGIYLADSKHSEEDKKLALQIAVDGGLLTQDEADCLGIDLIK